MRRLIGWTAISLLCSSTVAWADYTLSRAEFSAPGSPMVQNGFTVWTQYSRVVEGPSTQGAFVLYSWFTGPSTGSTVSVPLQMGSSLNVLARPVPNPAAQSATLMFRLAETYAHVDLDVFDIRGARVRRLQRGPLLAGPYLFTWDLRSDDGALVPAGVYLFRLQAGAHRYSERIAVVR
jgi:hypothetical protein